MFEEEFGRMKTEKFKAKCRKLLNFEVKEYDGLLNLHDALVTLKNHVMKASTVHN